MSNDSSDKDPIKASPERRDQRAIDRRNLLLGTSTLVATAALTSGSLAQAQQAPAAPSGKRPNILVIFGDDIGQSDISAYTFGLMGYKTPNIDRIAKEGLMFTDYYAEQSCTAGRSSFITGQSVIRTGMLTLEVDGKVQTFPLIKASKGSIKKRAELKNLYPI